MAEVVLERAFLRRLEERLAVAGAGLVEGEDALDQFRGLLRQRFRRADLRDEAGLQRALGRDGVANSTIGNTCFGSA